MDQSAKSVKHLRELTLDKTYDQSELGPGAYEQHQSSFPSKIDWQVRGGAELSNIRPTRATYSFGKAKKANEKLLLSS
jgi:hypothetical protein